MAAEGVNFGDGPLRCTWLGGVLFGANRGLTHRAPLLLRRSDISFGVGTQTAALKAIPDADPLA